MIANAKRGTPMKISRSLLISLGLTLPLFAADMVKTVNGAIEGTGPQASGVREFKGIPFAEPPTGELRWAPPQALKNWSGVRKADRFGARCMQQPLFGDMNFRSNGMSEDCLFLNVWTPAKTGQEKLPVLVYFFGGGFQAGDGSEPRYDGESMAGKGIVAVTVNYRLGVFGFLAHPELTKSSPHHASGNYALLDQNAALAWVKSNIAAFGGDPARVTIAGESAGSMAVSAQMASPLSKGLFAGAIGESGSILGTFAPVPLAKAEEDGVKFASALDAASVSELRALTTAQIFEASAKPGTPRFGLALDGYFFVESPLKTFTAGRQACVPLLAGWNSEEQNGRSVLGREAAATPENLAAAVNRLYGEHGAEVLKEYASTTNEEAVQAATDLASDRFIGYGTWKWIDLAAKTGGKPVYRYYYARARPAMTPQMGNAIAGLAGGVVRTDGPTATPRPVPKGAVHSAEIEYALGNLATNKVYSWTPDDYKVSTLMEQYFANFIKTGNPNGANLPVWPKVNGGDTSQFMRIDVDAQAQTEAHRGRYLVLDSMVH